MLRPGLGVAAVTAAALAVGLAACGSPTPPEPAHAPAPTLAPARRSVAIVGFANESKTPDSAWLSSALAELLALELGADADLRVVPGADVADVRTDLGLDDTAELSREALARLRSRLGCEFVVTGGYRVEMPGQQLAVDLRLQDAVEGRTRATLSQTGTTEEFLDLVARSSRALRRELGLAPPVKREGPDRRALPSHPRAGRLYAEGVARLRAFDALAARDLLEKAVEADPEYPLAHSALAEAWSVLGFDARARHEAERAFELAPGLPQQERLFVEARYREAMHQWDRAIGIYETLARLFPDDPDYALRLAAAQASAGRGGEAMATLDALRSGHGAAARDPRVDLEEARAANAWGDFERAAKAAHRVASRAANEGARLLEARARLEEEFALRTLGQPEAAVDAGDRAYELFAQAGDQGGQARALLENAGVRRYQGDVDEARRLAERALAVAQRIGDQSSIAGAANRIASVDRERGRLAEAERMYTRSRQVATEIGERDQEATALNNLGVVQWQRGRLSEAESLLRECVAVSGKVGHLRGQAYGSFNLGFVLAERGQLTEARRALEDALRYSRQAGDEGLEATALTGLARLARIQDDLASARRANQQALAARRKVESRGYVAESQTALAELSLDVGQPTEAEATVREAIAEFEREDARPNLAAALAVLSRSLLALGRHVEAEQAASRAAQLMAGSEAELLRDAIAIGSAQVRAEQTEPAQAVRELDEIRRRAHERGWLAQELECRLALGRLERRYGDPVVATNHLATLSRDATSRGFLRVARQAREAAR